MCIRDSLYLEYYKDMGIPEDFYWFTLEAAPYDGIHEMTREEMLQYELIIEWAWSFFLYNIQYNPTFNTTKETIDVLS